MNSWFKLWNFPLKEWPDNDKDRRAYVDPIFASIAAKYDFMIRALSFGQEPRWKRKAVGLIPTQRPLKKILDLACGTGEFLIHLRQASLEGQIIALDRSSEMLAIAVNKCLPDRRVAFIKADLMQIPFKDHSFDLITMGYGLRYLRNIRPTLTEVYRLLSEGGKFICLEFGIPKNQLYRRLCFGYLFLLGTFWGIMLHGKGDMYWHIVESLKVYPGQATVAKWLAEVGFAKIELHEPLGGIITILSGTRS